MSLPRSNLGGQALIIMGQSPPGESYNKNGIGKPLLNGPTEFGPVHPTEKQWTTSPTKLCRSGDILFCVRGATAGRINVADKEYCLGRGLAAIRGKPEKLDDRFLRHVLTRGYSKFQSRGVGSTFINISNQELENFEVPLLPLPEQKRIAAILDATEALREKRRQAIAKLDYFVQSVFLDMFGDPLSNPRKWPYTIMGDVCHSRLGKMLDEKKRTGQYPRLYLRNANVQWHRFDLSDIASMDFNQAERQEFSLVPSDLLMCEGGEPGRCAVWEGQIEECYFQKALHRIRPDPTKLNVYFLAHLFWHIATRGGFNDQITSATIAHLTGEKLKALKILMPPLELQHRFSAYLSKIDAVRTTCISSLTYLNTLFTSLQQRAFRGEL